MRQTNEPDYKQASGWWPEMPNKWTVLGAPNHYYKAAVFWNGAIQIATNPIGRGQRNDIPELPDLVLAPGEPFSVFDDGRFVQGWTKEKTPVLWTEWQDHGILLRQEAFVCVTPDWHGKPEPRRAGLEPIFVWLRYSIAYCCPGLPLEDNYEWKLFLNSARISCGMPLRKNITVTGQNVSYPHKLRLKSTRSRRVRQWLLTEPHERIRMGFLLNRNTSMEMQCPKEHESDHVMKIKTPAIEGQSFEILIPFIPESQSVFDPMMKAGYDDNLQLMNSSWQTHQRTRTRLSIPERPVAKAIEANIKTAVILGERYPDRNLTAFVVGYPQYAKLWGTPGAMQVLWMLDMFGHHAASSTYLEMFLAHQGDVKPPGSTYGQHDGYLAVPKWLRSIDWLSDHGAILYAICVHALLTNDMDFISSSLPGIIRACEWIRDSRQTRNHDGVHGLLPPAVATDRKTEIQSVWSDGWNFKGLGAAIHLLERLNHPRTNEFEAERCEYREVFREAFYRRLRNMPVWEDRRGVRHHLPPTSLAADASDETRHVFYLDTGPLFLVFSGLLTADEEPMKAALEWFRSGPARRMHRRDSGWTKQVAMLEHEISSMEPCYSWNLFHSHQTGDRQPFLEGMYSLWAGAHSKQTYTSCETRGGVTGTVFAAAMAAFVTRLSVIDDEWKSHELHLMRMTSEVWLQPGKACRFERMPTIFGPVTIRTKRSQDGRELHIQIKTRFHHTPTRSVLHVPRLEKLKLVLLNGKQIPNKRRIDIKTV